ncbi:MAG: ATP--guanido phosphotransferase [Christensenellaceae bacterium]
MTTLWSKAGPQGDVVISSRTRLARNYEGYAFAPRLKESEAYDLMKMTLDAFVEGGRDFRYLEMRALSDRERGVLMERHLISPELMGNPSAAVLLSTDETRSIMMNEEDHLRIQCILPGLQLRESYKSAAQMARTVEAKHAFAFDDRLGYLTCCPTNVGTGMRASVMVRLPALTLSGQIKGILDSIGKMGLTVRGIYGEGSEALGCVYQISNQVTLGSSEEDILQAVDSVVQQIVEKEREARVAWQVQPPLNLKDRLMRSYGVLRYACQYSFQEFMKLLSDVWLAADLGWISIPREKLLEAMIESQPSSLQAKANQNMSPEERDLYRARAMQEILTNE